MYRFDANGNGVQDAGEAGIANVAVLLLTSTGTLHAVTQTDASGRYSFNSLDHSLRPGETYVMSVRTSQDVLATLQGTVAGAGGDSARDSNGVLFAARQAMEYTHVIGAFG